MQATLKLRLHSTVNHVTAEMVAAERERSDDPMMVCKKRLENLTVAQLQQFHAAESPSKVFEILPGEFSDEGGKWVPVENVLEVLNAPSPKKGIRP